MIAQTVKAKLPKFIKRISIVKAAARSTDGVPAERVIVEPKRKRKKKSKGLLRVLENMVCSGPKATKATALSYQARHRRSNRKRRDGWMRSYMYNLLRAGMKGRKEIKFMKLFS